MARKKLSDSILQLENSKIMKIYDGEKRRTNLDDAIRLVTEFHGEYVDGSKTLASLLFELLKTGKLYVDIDLEFYIAA